MDQQSNSTIENQGGDSPLVTLFRHNLWANLRLIDACAALEADQLATSAAGTYGAIYDTLNHIARGEEGYLIHVTGQQPARRLRGEETPDIATIREHANASGAGLVAFAAAMTSDAIAYLNDDEDENLVWPAPAGFILTQAINHATEHRAQVMTILTQLGIEPPDLSGWVFMESTAGLIAIARPDAGQAER